MALQQTTSPAVTISPELKARLKKELSTYAELKRMKEDTEGDMEALKKVIQGLQEEAGVETLSLAGFTAYETTGKRTKTLNLTKVYATGMTPAELEACYDEKPAKDSYTIRCPGGKD